MWELTLELPTVVLRKAEGATHSEPLGEPFSRKWRQEKWGPCLLPSITHGTP